MYVLAPGKKEQTYDDILRVLLELEPQINPTDVMTDFELAAINALKDRFPLAELHGCHFHHSQNFWRHVQAVGLQTVYNENADFAFQLRLLMALAYVPVDSVVEAYEELVSTPFFAEPNEHKDAIESLLTYFQKTYIYDFDRFGKKKPPLFPVNLWNVFELTLSGEIQKAKKCMEKYASHLFSSQASHERTITVKAGIIGSHKCGVLIRAYTSS